MPFFNRFHRADINEGVQEQRSIPGSLLLDVRTPQEYASGHIPGSLNLPLDRISSASLSIQQKTTPIFVYCQSGMRSQQAEEALQHMGYTDVKNIGGISGWRGQLVR